MICLLAANPAADLLIVVLIGAVLFMAVRSIVRDRKNGKMCSGCSGCTGTCGCTGKTCEKKNGEVPDRKG